MALATDLPIPLGDVVSDSGNLCPTGGWAVVSNTGQIHVNATRVAEPAEWQYVLAHCSLHLCFEHIRFTGDPVHDNRWNIACDLFVARFLSDFGLVAPATLGGPGDLPTGDEASLLSRIETHLPEEWLGWGTAGTFEHDMVVVGRNSPRYYNQPVDWPAAFAEKIARSVRTAVAGVNDGSPKKSRAQEAMSWIVSSYPLLGAMAASFEIVEDLEACQNLGIQIAAVWVERKEIFLNPAVQLAKPELIFVMAHELLHVGLRHDVRSQGRDSFLWNIACDYVINLWLVEMGVGSPPDGVMIDQSLAGMSAEEIYDQIVADLKSIRRTGRLATFAGRDKGDIFSERSPAWWRSHAGVALDDFYRDALQRGLELHTRQDRGFLPAGLVEDIRALKQPPIPWDVQLADWFDEYFRPIERRRTYSRANRRQSATPDIPRPAWYLPEELHQGRTFAVVLDTSGSMDRELLGKGLGAIASYAASRDVEAVRLISCDASYHDHGYVSPADIGDRARVVGRGGTILQPAVNFLEKTSDFPDAGPILVITDGLIDVLRFGGSRPHAYLVPAGARLPFKPRGEVFAMS